MCDPVTATIVGLSVAGGVAEVGAVMHHQNKVAARKQQRAFESRDTPLAP